MYYSYPVARTYGYSPFAYPPGTRTPELTPPVAAVQFHNPYVQPKASGESPSESSTTTPAEKPVDKSASLPRMYYNPYVKQAATQTASTQ